MARGCSRTDRTSPRQWAGLALAWVLVQGGLRLLHGGAEAVSAGGRCTCWVAWVLLGVLYALYRSLPGDERAAIVVSGGLRKLTLPGHGGAAAAGLPGRLGQHQLRRDGLRRVPDVPGPMVARDAHEEDSA